MAGTKRASSAAETSRPHKQSKLPFGQKSASQQSIKPSVSRKRNQNADDDAWNAPKPAEHGFTITDKIGDIFDAPDHTIIIHACNTIGSWGAGIAAAFRSKYPEAYKAYHEHCKSHKPDDLVGTALLIPPLERDRSKPKHWIGCLFTSRRFGRARDSPKEILEATAPSMVSLLEQMKSEDIAEIRICQINSGLFSVPWERSKAVIESIEIKDYGKLPAEIVVYTLPSSK